MDDEYISEVEGYKVCGDNLDAELDRYDIDQFITNELENIEAFCEQLEYKYHGLKAKREAQYGT